MTPSILLFTWLSTSALGPPPGGSPTRDDLVAEAVDAFADGDFQSAIAAFERAYRLERRAVDLFNIARVYEELGEPEKARDHYKRFLAKPDLTAKERHDGETRLAALPAKPRAEPAERASAVASGEKRPEPKRPRRRNRDRMGGRTHWAVVTGGVLMSAGVASLATGTGLALTAMRNAKNAEASADAQTPIEETRHHELARRQAISADALLITGGVVTATGIVMLAAGLSRKGRRKARKRRDKRRTAHVAVAPAGAGLQVDVRF